MKSKTFEDLNVGDNLYYIRGFIQECIKLKIIDIIDLEYVVRFKYHYGGYSYIDISKNMLQDAKVGNIYADVNEILNYLNNNL